MPEPHELERLLDILHGCPQGVTVAVLHHGHSISQAVIEEALEHGVAAGEVDPLVRTDDVVRLRITPMGEALRAIDAAALGR
jgi:hypothetical protein